MGIPCRWHSVRIGMPQLRSTAVAIAFVIVGSSLLEAGVVGRTSIASSVSRAPITAVAGSRDALVSLALARPGIPVRPVHVATRTPRSVLTARAWSAGAWLPGVTGALRMTGPQIIRAGASAVDGQDALRALDPALPDRLMRSILAARAARGDALAGPATSTLVAAQGTTAHRKSPASSRASRLHKKHWRRPLGPWKVSQKVTWYGPGFYGNRTACGQRYTRYIVGVAHKTLPCGTLVQFRWGGKTAVAPVIDRGPYGPVGLKFDWSAWLACNTFRPRHVENGCFTRLDVRYRVVGKVNLKRWFKERREERRRRRG